MPCLHSSADEEWTFINKYLGGQPETLDSWPGTVRQRGPVTPICVYCTSTDTCWCDRGIHFPRFRPRSGQNTDQIYFLCVICSDCSPNKASKFTNCECIVRDSRLTKQTEGAERDLLSPYLISCAHPMCGRYGGSRGGASRN